MAEVSNARPANASSQYVFLRGRPMLRPGGLGSDTPFSKIDPETGSELSQKRSQSMQAHLSEQDILKRWLEKQTL